MPCTVTTHRDTLRRLTAAQKHDLTVRSDRHGLMQLGAHLAATTLCLWGNVTAEGLVRWAAILGQGIGMVFLLTAMHESSHGTAFRSRWLNRLVGVVAGMMLLIGPKWFFHFHQDHHKFTQDPDRDPELDTPKPSGPGGYLWHLSGIPFWLANIRVLLGNAGGRRRDSYVPEVMRRAVAQEARRMLAGYLVMLPLLAAGGLLVPYVLLPLAAGAPFLRAYLLAEHAGCVEAEGNMLLNTRTLLTTAPVRFLAWNMPYHDEHHCFRQCRFMRCRVFIR